MLFFFGDILIVSLCPKRDNLFFDLSSFLFSIISLFLLLKLFPFTILKFEDIFFVELDAFVDLINSFFS